MVAYRDTDNHVAALVSNLLDATSAWGRRGYAKLLEYMRSCWAVVLVVWYRPCCIVGRIPDPAVMDAMPAGSRADDRAVAVACTLCDRTWAASTVRLDSRLLLKGYLLPLAPFLG